MSDDVELKGVSDSNADFDAGFSGAPTETPGQAESATPDAGQQEPSQPQSQEQEPKYRQITEDEFNRLSTSAAAVEEMKATLGKQTDNIFGKIGGLERVLKQFQEQTPTGSTVEITEDDLAELRDEFPELVGPQLKMMQRIAGKMRGTGGAAEFDAERIHATVNPMLAQAGDTLLIRAKTEIAEETLAETHADWKSVIGMPNDQGVLPDTEYRKWLATQPDEYQQRINNSYSPVVIGKSIDKFREHQASLKKNAERRDRFDQAVTPKGDGGNEPPPDGDEAFNAGYNGK